MKTIYVQHFAPRRNVGKPDVKTGRVAAAAYSLALLEEMFSTDELEKLSGVRKPSACITGYKLGYWLKVVGQKPSGKRPFNVWAFTNSGFAEVQKYLFEGDPR